MDSEILLGLILIVVSITFSTLVVLTARRRIDKIKAHKLTSIREIQKELDSGR